MYKIQVLMSTYNGGKFIMEQIESILNQKKVDVNLLIRDDGSTDDTIEIIESYCRKNPNVSYYCGNNIKPAKSFMDLINNSDDNYDYYALSDQDDFWMNDKLYNALEMINQKDNNLPSFYFSNLIIVDESLNLLSKSNINFDISFESSLIKNPATGCTIVFDKKFKKEIKKVQPENIIMHDWWLYCYANSIDCSICYDKNSYIKYRQHSNNVLGYEKGIKKWKLRLNRFFHLNNLRLKQCQEIKKIPNLSKDKKDILDLICNYQKKIKYKIKIIFSKKYKTNSFISDLLFKINILFNKF